MISTLDLNDRTLHPLRQTLAPVRVWTRASWSAAWTLRPDLACNQVVWSAFPQVSTASLRYRYGDIKLPGAVGTATLVPITARGYWVLIAVPTDDAGVLPWLGYAETPANGDSIPATATSPITGTQTVPCFGMERLWDYCPIDGTVAQNVAEADKWRRHGNVGTTFNANARGNRTPGLGTLDDTRTWSAYAFAWPGQDAERWSTRDIVGHLLGFHAPTPSRILPNSGSDPAVEIPWRVGGLTALANWDAPTVITDGRMVGDILRNLVSPGRMAGLAIGPTATFPAFGSTAQPNVTAVNIVAQSRVADAIHVPGIGNLPSSTDGVAIHASSDPKTDVRHTVDGSDVVDQIIVRGPREVSVCTLRHGAGQWCDDWDAADELLYEGGAAAEADWDDWSLSERQNANARLRETGRLSKVFRDLKLDPESDGTVGESNDRAMFPDAATADQPVDLADAHTPFFGNLNLEPNLPLLDGVDYSGDLSSVDETGGGEAIGLIISLETPVEAPKRDLAELLGSSDWLLGVDFPPFTFAPTLVQLDAGPGLRMHVRGAPRFVIADSVTGNEADGNNLDAYDYTTLQTTVAIRGDRRPQWALPADVSALDFARTRVYDFDFPSLEFVYIVPDTVVSIDQLGDAQTSDGGILRDPMPRLRALAELLAVHVNVPRHRIVLTTSRLLSGLNIGQMVRNVDTAGIDAKAPITEIRVDLPETRPGDVPRVQMTVTAAAYRNDVLSAIETGRGG
ncbi:MAG: hypothetical protein AAGC97_03540 [Planctomycetota bacterium]